MATATLLTTWNGVSKSWTNSIGTLYIESAYCVYADLTAGVSDSYLTLGNSSDGNIYILRNYATTNQTLKDMLPIRLEITVNGTTYNFNVSSSTTPSGSSGNYYFTISRNVSSRLVQMTIPKDGSEFPISTTLKIKYNTEDEESFTFTQQACGTLYNSISGESSTLVTGRIYTYTLANAAVSTEKITPLIRLGYYQGSNQKGNPKEGSERPLIIFTKSGRSYSWYIEDFWEIEDSSFTEATVAIHGFGSSTIENYIAPYKITFLSNSYYLRVCFTQYYETDDFTSSLSGLDGIEIGNAKLNLRNSSDSGTVITGRDTSDDALRPEITGLSVTDSLRRPNSYIDWHGNYHTQAKTLNYYGSAISKYGNLVAGYSFCTFEPQINWKYGDTDNTGSTRVATAYVNSETSGTNILVRSGNDYYIQYQVPDSATVQIRIEVTVTGSIWGLSSATYTAIYSTITYQDPYLSDWDMIRCTKLYYQATDPMRNQTKAYKREHIGELWYCTADVTESGEVVYEEGTTYRMSVTGITTYGWVKYEEEYTFFTYSGTRYVEYAQGNYIKIEFTASFSSLNGQNTTKLIRIYDPTLTTITPTSDLYTTFKVKELSANSSLNVTFILYDDLCGAGANYVHKAETIETVLDFPEDRYSLGVGKVSEDDKTMDIRDGWTLRTPNIVIGNYTDGSGTVIQQQSLTAWMNNIEASLISLENNV